MKKGLGYILGFGALSIAASTACSRVVFDMVSKKDSTFLNARRIIKMDDIDWLESQKSIHYEITARDERKLSGELIKSDQKSNVLVLCFHGFKSTGFKEFASEARFYHELGYNVFIIDQRASGKSQGDYITFGSRESLDGMEWLKLVNEVHGDKIKIILHGVSMGAATVLMMCKKELPKNVVGVVCDCAYTSVKRQLCYTFKELGYPEGLMYGLYKQACFLSSIYDPERTNPIDGASKTELPIIFAHGKNDDVVPYEMTLALYDQCKSKNKTLLLVDGANHGQCFDYDDKLKNIILDFLPVMLKTGNRLK